MIQYHVPGKEGLPGNLFEPDKPYYQHDWQWYYPKLIHMIPDNSSVLDIGSGSGGLALHLKDNKRCHVTCYDMSYEAVMMCREKGLEARVRDVENERVEGKYDVVIMTAVLEHLINPRYVLWKVRNHLRDNGHIILAQSNFSDLLSRLRYLIGYNAKYYEEPATNLDRGVQPCAHLHLFNQHELGRILQLEDFEPVEWAYATQPYSDAYNPDFKWYRRLVAWLYHTAYELIANDLFSEIVIVKARKA